MNRFIMLTLCFLCLACVHKNKANIMSRIIFLIVLIVIVTSCNNVRTRDLTGRIVLDEIKASNDTVDFYIEQIELVNVERLKAYDSWYPHETPGINLYITITNKLNESIYLMPVNWYHDFFIGIVPEDFRLIGGDTIYFSNSFVDSSRLLEPKSSVDFEVSDFGIIDTRLFDLTQLDNIAPMLELVSWLKFYYAPSPLPGERNVGQDTIVINSTHRLRTDAKTKITSWSKVR